MLQGLTTLIPESGLTIFDNLEFLIRIILSCLAGAGIGLERTRRSKEAGIRTQSAPLCALGCTQMEESAQHLSHRDAFNWANIL